MGFQRNKVIAIEANQDAPTPIENVDQAFIMFHAAPISLMHSCDQSKEEDNKAKVKQNNKDTITTSEKDINTPITNKEGSTDKEKSNQDNKKWRRMACEARGLTSSISDIPPMKGKSSKTYNFNTEPPNLPEDEKKKKKAKTTNSCNTNSQLVSSAGPDS